MNGKRRRFEATEEPTGVMERARSRATEVGQRAADMVDHHPASTTALAFGAGVAAGLAVVALLHQRRTAAWYESYLPNWFPSSQLRQVMADSIAACHR